MAPRYCKKKFSSSFFPLHPPTSHRKILYNINSSHSHRRRHRRRKTSLPLFSRSSLLSWNPTRYFSNTVFRYTTLTGCTIEASTLIGCNIISCYLKDCLLEHCVVEETSIRNTRTVESPQRTILSGRKHTGNSDGYCGPKLPQPCMGLVLDSALIGSTVIGGKLARCEFQGSFLRASELKSCTWNNSPVIACKVVDAFVLNNFPLEVKNMIIKYVVDIAHESPDRAMHRNVMDAFRGSAEMYQEVLRCVFAHRLQTLKYGNWEDFEEMSPGMIRRMKELRVVCDGWDRMEVGVFPTKFDLCLDIRKLEIQIWWNSHEMKEWAQVALAKFPKLSDFRVRITVPRKMVPKHIFVQVKKLNEELGDSALKYDRCIEEEEVTTVVWNVRGKGSFDI